VNHGRVAEYVAVQNKTSAQKVVTDKLTSGTLTVTDLASDTLVVTDSTVINTLTVQQADVGLLETDTLDAQVVAPAWVETHLTIPTITASTWNNANQTTVDNLTVTDQLTAPNIIQPAPVSVVDVTTSGSTFVPWPANVIYAEVEATGAGGGGGGQGSSSDSGGGGGSSGYAKFTLPNSLITLYTGLTIDIGVGGAGGSGTGSGSAGTATTVTLQSGAPLLVCTCGGGGGGIAGSSTAAGGTPGATPVLAGVTGIALTGRYGHNSRNAGSANLGLPANNGADGVLGIGGRGAYAVGGGVAQAGLYGGGGGGGNNTSSQPGAAGGDGRCILTFYTGY